MMRDPRRSSGWGLACHGGVPISRVLGVSTLWLLGGLLAGCGENLSPPSTGAIEVTSLTTGAQTDPDGYTLSVDGDGGRALGANTVVTIFDLLTGNHNLTLSGIASNCILVGPNSRTVSLTSGATARTTFELECTAATGSIEITTATTGESLDLDGYLATLDVNPGRPVESNGAITFTAVTAGNHSVWLTSIAPNCTAGENPRTVVVAGDPVAVRFDLVCGPPIGSVLVSTVTGGLNPDQDGYAVSLDGGDPLMIDSNGSLTVSSLPVGDHTVELSGIATNCAVTGDNPRTVSVTNGGVAQVDFQVGCFLTGDGRVLFASNRSGTSHLYSVRQDGSDIVDLTPSRAAYDGDWSPDGSRIAFTTDRDDDSPILVMNADGSNAVGLGVVGTAPKWSPDGARLVFESGGMISVTKANGSQTVTLAAGRRGDWSPDGSRILFDQFNRSHCVFFEFCEVDLFVMAGDGSDLRRIKSNAMCGTWSPDGSRIAYIGSFAALYVMNADGTGEQPVAGGLPGSSVGCPVVWSPDASAIAYAAGQPDGTSEIVIVPAGGGPGAVLASSPASEFPESWK